MNETIYYKDGDDFASRPVFWEGRFINLAPVVVEKGLLRVGSDTYALGGVNSARLQTDFQQSNRHQNEIKPWRFGVYACYAIGFIGGAINYFLPMFLLLGTGLYVLYEHRLGKAKTLDASQHCNIGILVLERNGADTKIVIGSWGGYFNDELKSKLLRMGHSESDVMRYNEHRAAEVARAEAIVKAVGSAIVDTAMASSG